MHVSTDLTTSVHVSTDQTTSVHVPTDLTTSVHVPTDLTTSVHVPTDQTTSVHAFLCGMVDTFTLYNAHQKLLRLDKDSNRSVAQHSWRGLHANISVSSINTMFC